MTILKDRQEGPCLECLDYLELLTIQHPELKVNTWASLVVYLNRYPSADEFEKIEINIVLRSHIFSNFSDCGCTRRNLSISFVRGCEIVDVSHTLSTKSITGIQNFVRGFITAFQEIDPRVILVRHGRYGYSEIHRDASVPKIAYVARQIMANHKYIERLQKILPVRLNQTLKSFVLGDDDGLLIPLACNLYLPESILENEKVSRLIALAQSNTKVIMFLHDAFPISNPEIVSPNTKVHSANLTALLRISKLISCQTIAVQKVANGLLETCYSLEIPQERPRVEVHRRPILQRKSTHATYNDLRFNWYRKLALSARPFVVAVGTVEPRKNYKILIEACENLWDRGLDFTLVIIGGWGWKIESIKFLSESLKRRGRNLHFLTEVDNHEVEYLISKSSAFVFPSLAEGVGLPPGEALALGIKPICSAIPSITETFQSTDITFFDGTAADLASKIEMELRHKSESPSQDNLIVKEQSWSNMVLSILKDVEKLL